MKRLGDFLLNSPAAALLAATAALGLILYLIPPLHGAAWIIGLLSVALMAGVLLMLMRQWSRDQARIDQLNASLAQARGAVGGVSLSPVAEEEPGADTVLAQRILELFPTTSGLIQTVRVESGFSPLDPELLAPLDTFLSEFARSSFDNPATHTAFMDLHRAGTAFSEWVSAQTRVEDDLLEIVPGDERDGGWRSFSQAREEGEARTDELIRTRQAFERIALENAVL